MELYMEIIHKLRIAMMDKYCLKEPKIYLPECDDIENQHLIDDINKMRDDTSKKIKKNLSNLIYAFENEFKNGVSINTIYSRIKIWKLNIEDISFNIIINKNHFFNSFIIEMRYDESEYYITVFKKIYFIKEYEVEIDQLKDEYIEFFTNAGLNFTITSEV